MRRHALRDDQWELVRELLPGRNVSTTMRQPVCEIRLGHGASVLAG